MNEIQTTSGGKDGGRRRWRFHPAYLLVLLFMAFFAYNFAHKTQEVKRLAADQAALLAYNRAKAADNAREEQRIAYYRTLPYVEGVSRSLLGYTKPGEVSVLVNPVVPTVRVGPVRRIAAAPPEPTWRQWWRAFFG